MKNNELLQKVEELVDDFLSMQKINFSEVWRNDLISRVWTPIEKKFCPSDDLLKSLIIKTHYGKKYGEVKNRTQNLLKKEFLKASSFQIEFSVDEAWKVFLRRFDATKRVNSPNPELYSLLDMARKKFHTRHKKDSKELAKEILKDDEDNVILDKNGKPKTKSIRSETISSEDIPEFQPMSLQNLEDSENEIDVTEFGNKRFADIAFKEIFRFYSITGQVDENFYKNQKTLQLKKKLEHNKQALVKIHAKRIADLDQFELLTINNSSKFYKKRWKLLGTANERQWMELAISKLKESKEKKVYDLSQTADIEARNAIIKAPLLSSVLVCDNGKIFTCFKGEIPETIIENGGKRDITWDKHCEYSLFVDKVKDENMNLAKGGTLYVTLEPCNSRKPVKNSHHGKPKLPCAVRCVEAGLAKIYIGSFDYSKDVFENGWKILDSGEYKFELDSGNHKGETHEDIDGSKLLEKYFIERGYPVISSGKNYRTYKIGKRVEVALFDSDLIEEAYNINAEFQRLKYESNPKLKNLSTRQPFQEI